MINTYNYLKLKSYDRWKAPWRKSKDKQQTGGEIWSTSVKGLIFQIKKKIVQIRKDLTAPQKKKKEEIIKTGGYKRRNADVQYTF